MKKALLLTLVVCVVAPSLRAQQVPDKPNILHALATDVAPVDATAPTATHQPASPASASETPGNGALLLDAGDVLEVRVFDTPELSGKFRVDSHGNITLPVGGTVEVKGLTPEQVQTSIEQRFRQREILRDPHVEVFVLEYATQRVTVMGEVKSPGVYPIGGKRNVLDFISIAGGPTSSASKTALLAHKNSLAQPIAVDLSGCYAERAATIGRAGRSHRGYARGDRLCCRRCRQARRLSDRKQRHPYGTASAGPGAGLE